MLKLTADFETTTDELDCRVWAYGVCEIGNPDYFIYGNNIDDFLTYCESLGNATLYYHNLKFDAEFIMPRLFELGFTHVTDRKDLDTKTFTTLISKKGQFYSMRIVFRKKGKKVKAVTIYDSLKILPFSVEAIAEGFNLPVKKIKVEQEFYRRERPIGHKLTSEEINYLYHDVKVMALALDVLFKQGLEKMTQGSNALFDYKRTVTPLKFDKWFPIPNYDKDVRKSYRGGFTYLNPLYKGVDIKEGVVLDVNSLYPSVMHDSPLPYGEGLYFEGKYLKDDLYPLYIQMFSCQFELKPNHIPTVQLKNNLAFIPTEYICSSENEVITMTMTSVDLDLFFAHYNVYNLVYYSGWKFKSTIGLFTEYIDKWSSIKIQAKIDENYAMYLLAKLMLNALYGKFALNPNVQSKIPYYKEGFVKYREGEKEMRDPIYIPVGTFVTSWARYKTITSAQSVYDRFIYADTDSLHLTGVQLPLNLEIDDTKLGTWKHENTFHKARFLRQKSYYEGIIVSDKSFSKMKIEEQPKCYFEDGLRLKDSITCAGLPESCYQFVTWDNFKEGAIYDGKLQAKHVKGGIILKDTTFEIKAKKIFDKPKPVL